MLRSTLMPGAMPGAAAQSSPRLGVEHIEIARRYVDALHLLGCAARAQVQPGSREIVSAGGYKPGDILLPGHEFRDRNGLSGPIRKFQHQPDETIRVGVWQRLKE